AETGVVLESMRHSSSKSGMVRKTTAAVSLASLATSQPRQPGRRCSVRQSRQQKQDALPPTSHTQTRPAERLARATGALDEKRRQTPENPCTDLDIQDEQRTFDSCRRRCAPAAQTVPTRSARFLRLQLPPDHRRLDSPESESRAGSESLRRLIAPV